MPTKLTRREQQAVTRGRLLEAAGRVFARHGYLGASVPEIAAEAGYSTGALYSNFDGKEDLFLDLMESYVERQAQQRAELVSELSSVADRATAAANQFMDWLKADPEAVLLLIEFWAFAVRRPKLRPEFAKRYAAAREAVAQLIEEGAADLDVRLTVPALDLAAALHALANGLALQQLADPGSVPDDLFGTVVALLLNAASADA